MSVKEALYNSCLALVNKRQTTIQNTFAGIQEAMLSETKSSAGDKHETGRAMLQLEREKLGNQLLEVQKVKEILFKVDQNSTVSQVCLGSVIYTSQANYFISVSVGEITADNSTFYAIATNTPIGKLLLGKKVGDAIVFRNQSFVIEKIV